MIDLDMTREFHQRSTEAMVLAADLAEDRIPVAERPARTKDLAGRLDQMGRMARELWEMVEACLKESRP